MSAISDIVNAGNADDYMAAVTAYGPLTEAFGGTIPDSVVEGLRADFEADQLRTEGGFNLQNLMSNLGQVWEQLTSRDFSGALDTLMGAFNMAADPSVASNDRVASLARTGLTDEQTAVYDQIVGINGPTPGG